MGKQVLGEKLLSLLLAKSLDLLSLIGWQCFWMGLSSTELIMEPLENKQAAVKMQWLGRSESDLRLFAFCVPERLLQKRSECFARWLLLYECTHLGWTLYQELRH